MSPFPRRKPRPDKSKTPKTDWGGVAQWYDQLVGDEGSEYQREVVLPGVIRLLAPKADESMLDIACGQGVLARMLHERGVKMTGVDAARELIAAARQRSDPAITYHVGDARKLADVVPVTDHFDAAACVLAIQNIHPIHGIFEGVARALKSTG